MKFKIRILCLMVFYISNVNLYSKETKNLKWSAYQGRMSWEDAKTRCETIGMRLPTKLELQNAFQSKLTKMWTKDSAIFWTDEEFSINEAFDQFVSYNPMYWTSEENTFYEAYGFHIILGTFHKNNKLTITSLRCVSVSKK